MSPTYPIFTYLVLYIHMSPTYPIFTYLVLYKYTHEIFVLPYVCPVVFLVNPSVFTRRQVHLYSDTSLDIGAGGTTFKVIKLIYSC